ncbi:MAG: hypothetical protein KF838_10655 [Phycisphaeraceae bacterium]|nr:MAG: hypothetical protein KF838_10655 [Phycisphaeraceae bacterium]
MRRIGLKLDRAIQHWISRLSILIALAACSIVVAWAIGRTVSDRYLWTQYLAWIPTVLALPASFVTLVLSSAVSLLDEGADRLTPYALDRRRRKRRIAAFVRAAGWLGVACMAWTLLMHDLNLGARRTRTAAPVGNVDRFTAVYWNLANWPSERAVDLVRVHKPTLALLANAGYDLDREELRARIGSGAELLEAGPFVVVSTPTIAAWGITSLGFKGVRLRSEGQPEDVRIDPGRAMWIALDIGLTVDDAPKPFIVWILDLPSDIRLSRRMVAESTRRQLLTWQGTVFRRVSAESDSTQTRSPSNGYRADTSLAIQGFPDPDLIIGDFNIPRGSRSLDTLTNGPGWQTRDAFRQAGIGYAATWPLSTPLWHIDQAFLAPWLRATSYRVINPRKGLHWMQVVEFGAGG